MKYSTDIAVIGGGAAGMAAAKKAAEKGHKVILVERDNAIGGVLNQCIHNGFGLQYFGEDYTGPEFKEFLEEKVRNNQVQIISNSNVLELFDDKKIKLVNREGIHDLEFKALILTTGARERPLNSLGITGDRPAGVFTAGLAQRYINLMNLKPGNKALIVGSGDIGLIMARRLTLEGVEVQGVVEINPYPGGLERNIQQCLKDFDIPLYLSHSIRKIIGKNRVEKVIVSEVDKNFKFTGEEKEFDVDTVVASVGLIPETRIFDIVDTQNGFLVNNLNQTNIDWIFAAGNCTRVFDLVDYVSIEGERAAEFASEYINNPSEIDTEEVKIVPNENIGIMYPQKIKKGFPVKFYLRVKKPMDKIKIEIPELNYSKEFDEAVPSEMIKIKIKDTSSIEKDVEVNVYERS
ncbi:MAG: NAD(P)/FAD-dependent oxidoreductase [Thermotogota bacterium]